MMTTPVKRFDAAILATCVLPWDRQYMLIEDLFRQVVRTLRDQLTPHLYIFGTAGEGHAVTDRQYEQVVRLFRDETQADGVHGMVGVISLSLPTIIERIEFAHALGFRQFQVSLPSWGALNDHDLAVFFRETCGRFTDCQFLHYNLARSKRLLRGEDYARLACEHPNLVAVKVGGNDIAFLSDLINEAPQLQFFVGEAAYAALRDRYECGLLISHASCDFARAHEFFNARGSLLHEMTEQINAIGKAMRVGLGDECHMDGAFDKLLCKLHHPELPLRLLPPYGGASEAAFEAFKRAIPQSWRTCICSS